MYIVGINDYSLYISLLSTFAFLQEKVENLIGFEQ